MNEFIGSFSLVLVLTLVSIVLSGCVDLLEKQKVPKRLISWIKIILILVACILAVSEKLSDNSKSTFLERKLTADSINYAINKKSADSSFRATRDSLSDANSMLREIMGILRRKYPLADTNSLLDSLRTSIETMKKGLERLSVLEKTVTISRSESVARADYAKSFYWSDLYLHNTGSSPLVYDTFYFLADFTVDSIEVKPFGGFVRDNRYGVLKTDDNRLKAFVINLVDPGNTLLVSLGRRNKAIGAEDKVEIHSQSVRIQFVN